MYYAVLVLISFIIINNSQNLRDRKPTIRLNQGEIVGLKIYTESGKIADAFLGVPYAAPPTGPLRFAPPQKHHGWNGSYEAIQYKPPCPQLPLQRGAIYIEDCLYLNIWTPENAARFGPLPVVIFFEGIEFRKSNLIPISGQDLAMENLIIVSVNYRLNVFGFLCLQSKEVRGNFGLLDQYFSILWIRENIKLFGGDPDKITLFGHNAGAASVVLHMISPRTGGLFQKAIISTGSAVSPWHFNNDVGTASQNIIRLLGCTQNYSKSILRCLLTKTTKEILIAYEAYSMSSNSPDLFLPVIDTFLPFNDQYLPSSPEKVLRDGSFPQIPILTGISTPITDPQYKVWLDYAKQGSTKLQKYIEHNEIEEIITRYNMNGDNKDNVIDVIKWQYDIGINMDVKKSLENLKRINLHTRIEVPHFLQLNYLLSSYVQPIYVYYLDEMDFEVNINDTFISSDILLLFGPLFFKQMTRKRFQNNEYRFSKHIKQLWTNFITFGNPTPDNGHTWNNYKSNTYHIENLGNHVENDRINDVMKRVALWTQLLSKLSHPKNLSNYNIVELQRNPDIADGYKHAVYTLLGLVIALLGLLLICIVLLKKHSKERQKHFHIGF